MHDLKRNTGHTVMVFLACVLASGCQMSSWNQAGFSPGSLPPGQAAPMQTPNVDLGDSTESPQTYETERPSSPPPEKPDTNNLEELTVPQAKALSVPPLRGPIMLGQATREPFPEGLRRNPEQPSVVQELEPAKPQSLPEETLKPQPLPVTKAPESQQIMTEPADPPTELPETTSDEMDEIELPPLVSDEELKEQWQTKNTDESLSKVEPPELLLPPLDSSEPVEAPEVVEQPRPAPEFEVVLPESILVGEPVPVEVRISAPEGDPWTDLSVTLKPDPSLIPTSDKQTLIRPVPELVGEQSTKLVFELQAMDSGNHQLEVTLLDGDRELGWKKLNLSATSRPLLTELTGPEEKPVDGRAEYTLKIENVSSEAQGPIHAVFEFDGTLNPVEASAGAEQKPGQLLWQFPVLHPGEQILLQVEFECPVATSRTCVSSLVSVAKGPEQKRTACLKVNEPSQTLRVEVLDRDDLTHIGREFTGLVRITNRGLRPASNIRTTFDVPAELSLQSVSAVRQGQEVTVEQSGQERQVELILKQPLAADQTVELQLVFMADEPADAQLTVEVTSAGLETPVRASEPFMITP